MATEYNTEFHYSTFYPYIPKIVVKPKPEDSGTCLCMICLNPELRQEALKKYNQLNLNLDVQMLVNSEEEIIKLMRRLKEAM